MRTLLMQVFIKCMMVIAERRLIKYERSGSFLALSWLAAISFALLSY